VAAGDVAALGLVVDEVIDLGNGPIENGYGEAVIVHVQDQVLAHDRKADQADVAFFVAHVPFPLLFGVKLKNAFFAPDERVILYFFSAN